MADELRKNYPDAWEEGNERLYQHFKESAKGFPDNLTEMLPLYQAVAHGCRAGLHQQALDEVYWPRIARKSEAFAVKSRPWDRPSSINKAGQAFLLNAAGFHLRAMGHLSEAAKPMRAALKVAQPMKDWGNAARYVGNLSELHLVLANITQAVADARHSRRLADRSEDPFETDMEPGRGAWTRPLRSRKASHPASIRSQCEFASLRLSSRIRLSYSCPQLRRTNRPHLFGHIGQATIAHERQEHHGRFPKRQSSISGTTSA